jgi:hypothetical protein
MGLAELSLTHNVVSNFVASSLSPVSRPYQANRAQFLTLSLNWSARFVVRAERLGAHGSSLPPRGKLLVTHLLPNRYQVLTKVVHN